MIGFANVFFRPYLFFLTFFYSACTSWVNGYVTGKIMKAFGGTEWCFAAFASIVVFPTYVVAIFVSVDMIEYLKMSSSRTAPLTIIGLGLLWLVLAVPLCCLGAQRAFASEKMQSNIHVNQLRRKIPELPFMLKRRFALPIFGAVIFGSVFGEFQYVMKSVWRSYMYAMFGFLFVNLHLLVAVVSLLSIVYTYVQLNAQNWKWWWNAFLLGMSAGVYMGGYSLYFMVYNLNMDLLAGEIVYLLYMFLFTTCFAFMCGAISVTASYVFVTRIYAGIKGE